MQDPQSMISLGTEIIWILGLLIFLITIGLLIYMLIWEAKRGLNIYSALWLLAEWFIPIIPFLFWLKFRNGNRFRTTPQA